MAMYETIIFYSLAALLSAKWGDDYSVVLDSLALMLLRLFLLCSAIQCIQQFNQWDSTVTISSGGGVREQIPCNG